VRAQRGLGQASLTQRGRRPRHPPPRRPMRRSPMLFELRQYHIHPGQQPTGSSAWKRRSSPSR
jgi:hypothetical protein